MIQGAGGARGRGQGTDPTPPCPSNPRRGHDSPDREVSWPCARQTPGSAAQPLRAERPEIIVTDPGAEKDARTLPATQRSRRCGRPGLDGFLCRLRHGNDRLLSEGVRVSNRPGRTPPPWWQRVRHLDGEDDRPARPDRKVALCPGGRRPHRTSS